MQKSIIIGIFVAIFVVVVAAIVVRCSLYRSRPARKHSSHYTRHVPFRHQRYDAYLYAKPAEEGRAKGSASKSSNMKSAGSSLKSYGSSSLQSGKSSLDEKESVAGTPRQPGAAHIK